MTARDRRPGGDIPLTLGGWQNHSPQLGRITGLLCKVWFLIPADASAVSARLRADATAGPPAARKDAELNYGCGSPAAGRGRLCLPGATSPRLKSRLHSPFHVNPEKRNEPGCLTHRKAPEELACCPWLKKGRGCAVRYPASGSGHKCGAQLSVLRARHVPAGPHLGLRTGFGGRWQTLDKAIALGCLQHPNLRFATQTSPPEPWRPPPAGTSIPRSSPRTAEFIHSVTGAGTPGYNSRFRIYHYSLISPTCEGLICILRGSVLSGCSHSCSCKEAYV